MDEIEGIIAELGNEPPLLADGRSGPPDKREVSARWLSGTFLTGVTSSILMGVALLAALDGREQLATPPEIMKLTAAADDGESGEDAKTTRLSAPRQIARAKDRRRMDVPTVTRVGDRDVIRNMPFVQIKMALAAGHKTTRKYPAFDPVRRRLRGWRAVAGRDRHLLRRRGQGRKRHEHKDRRLSDGDGRLRREERAFGRRGRRGRPLDRLPC